MGRHTRRNGMKISTLNDSQLVWQSEIIDNTDITLTDPTQQKFCDVYMDTGSITEAYIASHPNNKSSRKTLRETASRYFKRYPILTQYIIQQNKKTGNGIKTLNETLQALSRLTDAGDAKIRLGALKELKDYYLRMQDGNKGKGEVVKFVYTNYPTGKKQKQMDAEIEAYITRKKCK